MQKIKIRRAFGGGGNHSVARDIVRVADLDVNHCDKSHRVAFTLAEVLITLGIIGVVAAMTLPTIIANYKKQVYVTQLKKTVSTWEQGFQKMLADDGVDSLKDTETFKSINGSSCDLSTSKETCAIFYDNLNKLISINSITSAGNVNYKYKYIHKGSSSYYPGNSSSNIIIFLKDGSSIHNFRFLKTPSSSSYSCEQIKRAGGKMCEKMGTLSVDVNGLKGPNIEGRDIFDFYISGTGRLVPLWSKDDLIYHNLDDSRSWEHNSAACGTKGIPDAETVAQYGSGCAARVISNGWVMDY